MVLYLRRPDAWPMMKASTIVSKVPIDMSKPDPDVSCSVRETVTGVGMTTGGQVGQGLGVLVGAGGLVG